MNVTDVTHLNGRSVLVKSTAERSDPAVAVRGSIEVHVSPQGDPTVEIVLEFPHMCNRAAHQRVLFLNPAEVERLLASEREGVFEYTISGPLDS